MDTDVKFSVMAALMEKSRGMGYKGLLPWPFIKKDVDYYRNKVTQKKDSAKKNIFIMGRVSWLGGQDYYNDFDNIIYIIVSKTLRQERQHKGVEIVPTFQAAVELADRFYKYGEAENVWIMGGQPIYTEAVFHPSCERVYITRVYKEYPADTFFTRFESSYDIVSKSRIEEEVDGIRLQFFVYEPKRQGKDVKSVL